MQVTSFDFWMFQEMLDLGHVPEERGLRVFNTERDSVFETCNEATTAGRVHMGGLAPCQRKEPAGF